VQHILFQENGTYAVALLIKDSAMKKTELEKHYTSQLSTPDKEFIAFNLEYVNKKAPVKLIKKHLSNILKACDSVGVKTLYCLDGPYFKVLAKQRTAEPHYGYVYDCAIEGFEHMKVILGANYQGLFFNPLVQDKIDLGNQAMETHLHGLHINPGTTIIHSGYFPQTIEEIDEALEDLHQYPEITLDTETFDLQIGKAGIGTVSMAWDEHNGIAFCCDYEELPSPIPAEDGSIHYGKKVLNKEVRASLLRFLMSYQGKIIYHNANFDIKILIFALFMCEDHFEQAGMIEGLEVMTQDFDDTKLITYLAINSTARNSLRLKDLAQSFAGNYAEDDIIDIRRIPKSTLLQYNLVDCLSTWFVRNRYYDIMVDDKQLAIYHEIIRPSVKTILQMELTGMPMNKATIEVKRVKLSTILEEKQKFLQSLPIIQQFTNILRMDEMIKANEKLKVKVKPIEDFNKVVFNPASNTQKGKLLHEILKMPILDRTPTKEPSVGNKTLEKLVHLTTNPDHLEILDALMAIGEVSIILNTFIIPFGEMGIMKSDGMLYLHGNFNLGGTVSGRLSSSGPNMQNIPSTGTIYAKDVKECFEAPPGWLMAGADFASLEDKISALTTKDPNKLKVYTDGYDGHCLRAYTYFGEHMPDIDPLSVASINSIAINYKAYRQESKAPTFLLTYGGTYHGLVANVGLTEESAIKIESQYHELYKVSDDWVFDKIKQASIDGYITVAFGLRVRTPILAQTILGKKSTPKEAKSEGRTAGNALGQSYGLLNNRAGIEFQRRVLASKFALDIKPIAQIHDAQYHLIRDNYEVVKWYNDNMVECMKWQNLPEIMHPTVKLGGDMEIFHPTWANKFSIANDIGFAEIRDTIERQMAA
jgi:DNA polymerase-1